MNAYLLLAAAVAMAVLTGGAYMRGRSDGEAKIISQQAREEQVARAAVQAATSAAAEAISKIEVKNVYQRQIVEREVRENVVYRNCRHSPDGLRSVNAALTGAEPEPAGDRKLPAASAPGR